MRRIVQRLQDRKVAWGNLHRIGADLPLEERARRARCSRVHRRRSPVLMNLHATTVRATGRPARRPRRATYHDPTPPGVNGLAAMRPVRAMSGKTGRLCEVWVVHTSS